MDDFENILCCSICIEIFQTPRVLPCQHTFCEECLTTYINDRAKRKQKSFIKAFPCPLCRDHVIVNKAPNDASVFPLNLTVVALVDKLSNIQNKTKRKLVSSELDSVTETDSDIQDEAGGVRGGAADTDEPQMDCYGGEVDFEKFESSELFSGYAVENIILPILTSKWYSVKVVPAAIKLLLCLIIYVYTIQFIIVFDVKVILCILCYPLSNDMVKCAKKFHHMKDNRDVLRQVLGTVVSHIVSVALVVSILILVLFSACVIESIRSKSRGVTLSNKDSNRVIEYGQKELKYILRKSWQMMSHSLNNLHIQWRLSVQCLLDYLRSYSPSS